MPPIPPKEMVQAGGGLASCSSRSLFVPCGGSNFKGAFVGPDLRHAATPPIGGDKVSTVTTGEPDVRYVLELSAGQVQGLVQMASRRDGGRGLLWVVLALEGVGERIGMEELARDERYQSGRVSRSTIISLVVLGAFALGEIHGVKGLADELGMSVATTWRYVNTWVEVGVLGERKDRRYQLAGRWQRELPKTSPRRAASRAK